MPNQPVDRPAVARAIAASELLQQRMMMLYAAEFTALDITMAQAKLLYVLAAAGELSMSETARRLGVTVSTASGAVDHLVEAGLLARVDNPDNRRQVRVSVTEQGGQTLEQMRELSTRHMRLLFALIDDDDLAVVERATLILAQAVDEAAALQDEAAALRDEAATLRTDSPPTTRSTE